MPRHGPQKDLSRRIWVASPIQQNCWKNSQHSCPRDEDWCLHLHMSEILWQFMVIFRTSEFCSTVEALTLLQFLDSLYSFNWFLKFWNVLPLLLCTYGFYCHHPTWNILVIVPELCCWMSFICWSTIFIPSFSSLKISPGVHNQVLNLPSGTRSCLYLPWFHLCIPRSYYFQTETFVLITLLLLITHCFSLKCPLPCLFLYLNITTLSKMSSSLMSFHKAYY